MGDKVKFIDVRIERGRVVRFGKEEGKTFSEL